jgi:hypothetical protein
LDEADLVKSGVLVVREQSIDAEGDAFIFDFGLLNDNDNSGSPNHLKEVSDGLQSAFLHIVRKEQGRLELGLRSRRIVTLNTINNSYESFVLGSVSAGLTPFSTRMRHGFVRPAEKVKVNWLRRVFGPLGQSISKFVRRAREAGHSDL